MLHDKVKRMVETAAVKPKEVLGLVKAAEQAALKSARSLEGDTNPQARQVYLKMVERSEVFAAVRKALEGQPSDLRDYS